MSQSVLLSSNTRASHQGKHETTSDLHFWKQQLQEEGEDDSDFVEAISVFDAQDLLDGAVYVNL
jgi:hypothetical protein